VARYWTPEEFEQLGAKARELGFQQVRSGPLVRSSYHAAGSMMAAPVATRHEP
jgi:lipoyl synthase